MISFIHFSDLHVNKIRKDICVEALHKIGEIAINKHKTTKVMPKILFAGDFFDSTITNTEASGFSSIVNAIKELNDISNIYMISGTPSHDVSKSLEIFKLLGIEVFSEYTFKKYDNFELVALPEPRRSDFLKIAPSSSEIESVIVNETNKFIDSIPEKTNPRVCIGHNEIIGGVMQNGKPCSSNIAFTKEQLNKINADYYAFGHIHMNQKINGVPNCYYSGSVPPKDFGETLDSGIYYVEIR